MAKKRKTVKKALQTVEPLAEWGLNLVTIGLGSTLFNVLDKPKNEIFKKNLIRFVQETVPKIKWLEKQVGKEELYKRLNSPEGMQIMAEIGGEIEKESREFNRLLLGNLVINLFEEDIQVNFDRKLQYASFIKSLSKDNATLLWLFRKDSYGWFKEDEMVERMGTLSVYNES
jgi:hypothetical protein